MNLTGEIRCYVKCGGSFGSKSEFHQLNSLFVNGLEEYFLKINFSCLYYLLYQHGHSLLMEEYHRGGRTQC